MKTTFVVGALTSLIVSALIGIYIFLAGTFGEIQQKLLLTVVLIGVFSIFGLANSISLKRTWMFPLCILGIFSSAASLLLLVLSIWELLDVHQTVVKVIFTLIVVSFTSSHVSLLSIMKISGAICRMWQIISEIIPIIIGVMIVGAIWEFLIIDNDGIFFRVLGVAIILDVLASVGIFPLSNIMSRKKTQSSNVQQIRRRRR